METPAPKRKRPAGGRTALAAAAVALAIAAALAVSSHDRIQEAWYYHRLRTADGPARYALAESLAEGGVTAAIVPMLRLAAEDSAEGLVGFDLFGPGALWELQRCVEVAGPAAVPPLVRFLRTASGPVAVCAATALLDVAPSHPASIAALSRGLLSDREEVRSRSLEILQGSGEILLPHLERALREGPPGARLLAVDTLRSTEAAPADALALVRLALGDPSLAVRVEAAWLARDRGVAPESWLSAAIEGAGADEEEVRANARGLIEELEPADRIGACARILEASSPEGQVWALGQIEWFDDAAPVRAVEPAFRARLSDLAPMVRLQAAGLLGGLGASTEDVLPVLVAGLRDPDASVRAEAARWIGENGPDCEEARPALLEALRDPSPLVRVRVAAALDQLGCDPGLVLPVLIEGLTTPGPASEAALDAVAHLAPSARRPAIPALVGRLKIEGGWNRTCLGYVPPEHRADALPFLLELLDDPRPGVRGDAVSNLGHLGPAALPALRRALEDADQNVRARARSAIEDVEAGPDAYRRARDPAAAVRAIADGDAEGAMAALSRLAHSWENAVETALGVLETGGDPALREAACRALARMGPVARRAAPRLRRAAGDPDPRIRAAAEEAVRSIREDAPAIASPADRERIEALLDRALRGGTDSDRALASRRLGLLGIRDVRRIAALLGDPAGERREVALDALARIGPASSSLVPALIPVLEDPCMYSRARAAWILAKFGRDAVSALPALEKALRDRKRYVRGAARDAIEEIRGDRDEPGEEE